MSADSDEFCEKCGQRLPIRGGPLGELIRSRRMATHLSLRQVERLTNGKLSNVVLHQMETGRVKNPSISVLLLVSAALAIPIEDMVRAIDPTYVRPET